MKNQIITLIITAVWLSIISCSGQKSADTISSDETKVEVAADLLVSSKNTLTSATVTLVGKYTDTNDGSTLTITQTGDNKYLADIDLFRLTSINNGVCSWTEGALSLSAKDAAGNPIKGRITFDSDTAHLTFTQSTWKYLSKGTSFSFIRNASVNYEPANPVGGRIYTGNGNGGGLGTKVTIKFEKDSICECTSDFYQAFTKPVTVKGKYSIRYDIIKVECHPEGFESPIVWEFEIKSDGEELSFNKSDSSAAGSIGNNWLHLHAQ